ncbi:MAG TPA: MarR family transcriptional regulator [Candidatus Aenigmarchaeota archaeon]|nr:MarR family transcriptional regulator [Candidatus Aenigmarchaeota archaeon]
MPKSARKIIGVLSRPLSAKEIKAKTNMPERTIRYAIAILKSRHLVEEKKSLSDMREVTYSLMFPCF